MAYKYEEAINNQYELNRESGRRTNTELIDELKEVYRKAKAFDEVIKASQKEKTYEQLGFTTSRIASEYWRGN